MKLSELLDGSDITYVTYDDCPDLEITDIVCDSRRVRKGSLFVCLSGTNTDGHRFLAHAAECGAAAAVCEIGRESANVNLPKGFPKIFVGDTHAALSRLLDTLCGKPSRKMRFIGVTGTNGKTSVSYMIKAVYERAGHMCGLIGTECCKIVDREIKYRSDDENANMTTPDPPQLYPMLAQMAQEGVDTVIMEATSHALAQKKLAPIFFDTAIFTNLTPDHLDYHGNMENYFAAKCVLFRQSKRVIINVDDAFGKRIPDMLKKNTECVLCSASDVGCDFCATDITTGNGGVSYKVNYKKTTTDILCLIPASFTVMNSLEAFACGICDGIEKTVAASALAEMSGVCGRMERVKTPADDISVYIDYAHTPDALEKLLGAVADVKSPDSRIVIVFGCGGDRDRTKRAVMGQIAAKLADSVYVTSDNSRTEDRMRIINDIIEGIPKEDIKNGKVRIVPDRTQAITEAILGAYPGDNVILAGKGHETYEINKSGRHPFDERKTAKEAAEMRNRKSRGEFLQ